MAKDILRRALIIGLIIVLLGCVGGVALLHLPIILLVVILVIALGITSYIIHNRKE